MTIEAAPPQSNATALLLNPSRRPDGRYPDERSDEIMRKTIEFFENKGKSKLKGRRPRPRLVLGPARLLQEGASLCDAADAGTIRRLGLPLGHQPLLRVREIVGFYGLHYWYVWQVSILGLGPIWMSPNEQAKQRAAKLLEDGAIFGFGLSEREHGADLYSSDMELRRRPTAATSPTATSTTSATATRQRWSRPSAS